jgi:hypothetical protein
VSLCRFQGRDQIVETFRDRSRVERNRFSDLPRGPHDFTERRGLARHKLPVLVIDLWPRRLQDRTPPEDSDADRNQDRFWRPARRFQIWRGNSRAPSEVIAEVGELQAESVIPL